MFVFAASGMRRRQSTASWYFCICRYWDIYPGFWIELDELWSYSWFLLVLCPDCNSVHSCMPFPECRVFSCFIVLCPCILHPSGDRACCICFSPSFYQVEVCYLLCKEHTHSENFEDEDQQNFWELPVLVNIAHRVLSHHFLKIILKLTVPL